VSQPEPQRQPVTADAPLTVLCSECGCLIEVVNPAEIIRALHLRNDCTVSPLLAGAQE